MKKLMMRQMNMKLKPPSETIYRSEFTLEVMAQLKQRGQPDSQMSLPVSVGQRCPHTDNRSSMLTDGLLIDSVNRLI